ncbi:MAG: ROK family protein [Acidimicrobiia bacterium]
MERVLGALEAGGTKFRAAVVDEETLEVGDQVWIPTTTPTETLGAVIDFFRDHPAAALGIASFGPLIVDRSADGFGSVGPTPKPGWTGAPLLSHLSNELSVPADIQTDVEAAAVAEAEVGAGRGHRRVGYVTVGTGIGGAVAVDGVPYRGSDHTEIGHVPVRRVDGDDFPGRCPFHGDCLEGMACGPAIADRWNADPASLEDRDEVWDLEAKYLAQLVRVYAYSFAPDIVLFGGGVGTRPDMAPRIQAATLEDLGGYSVTHSANDELVATAGLGADAGLIGAALLARSLLWTS